MKDKTDKNQKHKCILAITTLKFYEVHRAYAKNCRFAVSYTYLLTKNVCSKLSSNLVFSQNMRLVMEHISFGDHSLTLYLKKLKKTQNMRFSYDDFHLYKQNALKSPLLHFTT